MAESPQTKIKMMSGNEACALGALAAGLRFYAGYPITPSSEIAEELSILLPQNGGSFIQMEDEIASMGAVIGASLAGLKSMTATSGPGFSLKQENIGYAIMAEVPCVIVNVMRGGPSTGLPTLPSQGDVMQARWGTHGDHDIVALVPNSVTEIFHLTVRAFNLSEKFRTPVILLLDEIIAHIIEKIVLPDSASLEVVTRKKPDVLPEEYLPYRRTESMIPPMASFGEGYRFHVTGLCHDESGFPTNNPEEIVKLLTRLNQKLEFHRDEIIRIERFLLDDAQIAVFAYGSASRSAKRAVLLAREKGIRVGLFRPMTLWPFARQEVFELARQVRQIIVPELNLGQMAQMVEWASRGQAEVYKVNRIDGEPITPEEILDQILRIA